MEVDLPLGWKLLSLEHYDGTTNLDEHIDVFFMQANIYTMTVITYPSAGGRRPNRWAKALVSKGENKQSRHQH